MLLAAAFWLCTQRIARDVRSPLVPAPRFARVDRSFLAISRRPHA